MTETPQELAADIAKLLQLAHETGFNAGRQAAADYVKMSLSLPILDSPSVMSKEAAEHFFERQQMESLSDIVRIITKG